ncbi:Uncharacterised protein [Burkholderia pseudomallei]|uniref:hypothetical protein n=1 Tax=Burkholderia pseudomallei TaxID=28450 RepID=UPI000F051DDC|nr:hypothetical protein [Burkholderia pseudomallei]CAJ6885406.1 Uncharacterised protein [Burkholderia pseudomallei]VBI24288.1 Uncharacterised protein [Burkholderia pseudomallei]
MSEIQKVLNDLTAHGEAEFTPDGGETIEIGFIDAALLYPVEVRMPEGDVFDAEGLRELADLFNAIADWLD